MSKIHFTQYELKNFYLLFNKHFCQLRSMQISWAKFKESKLFPIVKLGVQLAFIYVSWKIWIFGIVGKEDWPLETRLWPWFSSLWEHFNDAVRIFVLTICKFLLTAIGENAHIGTHIDGARILPNYTCYIEGFGGVALGNYCLGFQLIYYFCGLIFIAPLSSKTRWIAIPLSLIGVQLLNAFRVAGLVYIDAYRQDMLYFAHDYGYNALVMGILLTVLYLLIYFEEKKNTAMN